MGGATFTPKQRNWRVYADGAGPTSPLANENVRPTLANNTDIIRVRISIAETGGKANNNAATVLEYSTNQTDWFTLGAASHWNHADGADTDQSIISSRLLSDSGASGEYCESATSNVSYGASAVTENDMSVVPTGNVSAETTYYFRTVIAGTAVPLDTAETYPQVLTAVAGGTDYTRNIGDSEGITDSAKRTVGYARNVGDNEGVTDSVGRAVGYGRNIEDSEGVTDSARRAVGYARVLTEEITATDANGEPGGGVQHRVTYYRLAKTKR